MKEGTSLAGLLGVVFVTLKLCGIIDWSWWWVTLPFYAPVVLFILFLIVIIILGSETDNRKP